MRTAWLVYSVPILLVFALVAAFSGGAAEASTGTGPTHANSPPRQVHVDSRTCLSPLILASGGLCCPGTQSSMEPCLSSNPTVISAAVKKLKPLMVNGVRIPLPVTLQMIKKALGRVWSTAAANRDVLVCAFRKVPGTRVPLLHCNTNYVHFKGFIETDTHIKLSDRKVHCYYNCFLTRENIVASLVRYVNHDIRTARVLGSLLDKVPAADATYSLRVTETVPMWLPDRHLLVDNPAYVTFVIGDGGLADVQLSEGDGKIEIVKHMEHNKRPRQRVNVGPPGSPGMVCTATAIQC